MGERLSLKADDFTEADDPSFIFVSKSRRSQPTYFGTNADDPVPKRTILIYVFWVSESNILGGVRVTSN